MPLLVRRLAALLAPALAVLVALVAAGPAAAQWPASGPAQLTVRLDGVSPAPATTLAGQRFVVRGTLAPYGPAESVTLRVLRSGRTALRAQVAVTRAPDGTGAFAWPITLHTTRAVTIVVDHAATPRVEAVRSAPMPLAVVQPGTGPVGVRLLQRLLAARGYAVPHSGVFDDGTARAVLAFRKLTGRARTSEANRDVFVALLRGEGAFRVRFPSHGHHVEGDVTHQVLALIGPHGHVERIYTMSSGKPSTPTVLGHFRVYRKEPGTNDHGMVYSDYFQAGYAIHGYASVPNYPGSHGCLRLPVPDAIPVYDWIRLGDPVDVYC